MHAVYARVWVVRHRRPLTYHRLHACRVRTTAAGIPLNTNLLILSVREMNNDREELECVDQIISVFDTWLNACARWCVWFKYIDLVSLGVFAGVWITPSLCLTPS